MKKFLVMAVLAITTAMHGFAQYQVKFQVNDSTGEGEPYATVRIYKQQPTDSALATNKPLKAQYMGVTTVEGAFSQDITEAGAYTLCVSATGKEMLQKEFTVGGAQKTADLGTLIIKNNENMLAGVTVTAAAPLIESEIDRIAYNVQNDEESKSNTIFEMLRKVPLVSVDGEDNIMVNGSSNFKIYKNGRKDPAMSNNPKDVLKSIPASMIKRIEVITEPGAKYDAEGVNAILNIVTNDGSSLKGVTGTASLRANQYGSFGGSIYLTSQIDKVVTEICYGTNLTSRRAGKKTTESEFTYNNGTTLKSLGESFTKANFNYTFIESSWEPDTMNLVSLAFNGYWYTLNHQSQSLTQLLRNGNLAYSYRENGKTPKYDSFSFDGRVDYEHRTQHKDETLSLSYMLSTTRKSDENAHDFTDILGDYPYAYTSYSNGGVERFLENTVQFDWTRPFATHHKVETGLKYINRSNKSLTEVLYNGAPELNNTTDFNHLTQVAAGYFSYTYNVGNFSTRAGVRYEYSHLSAKYRESNEPSFSANLNDWVPSLSFNYKFTPMKSVKLAFSTNINRPGITYLNPARITTPTSEQYGNPLLESARNYNFSATYMSISPKFTFNISPSFSFSPNRITTRSWVEGDKRIVTYGNILKTRSVGSSIYAQWSPSPNTRVVVNGVVRYEYNKSTEQDIKNDGVSYNAFANFSQKIIGNLRFNFFCFLDGGTVSGLYAQSPTIFVQGLSLQYSLLKDDRLSIGLQASNPFGGKYLRLTEKLTQGDYTGYNTTNHRSRELGIKISYRFGSLKAEVKKTATSIENTDMVGGNSKGN